MRVLLAPDKFRGTFTAAEVCEHLARGLSDSCPGVQVDAAPMADGGEGTLDAIMGAAGGTRIPVEATGPDGAPIVAEYGVTQEGLAVIESARFCGLELVAPSRRDPSRASSYGLGQALAVALDAGARRFVIGLGGTATVDAGAGMARALGYRFEDQRGVWNGQSVLDLGDDLRIDDTLIHEGLRTARFSALCDVDNPLLGPRGAARVFAPQKGATGSQVAQLEEALCRLSTAMAKLRAPAGGNAGDLASGGAGGGLGLGCFVFLGASLLSGAIYLMKTLMLDDRIAEADLVVTGEGSFDGQTSSGKVVAAVLEAAAGAGRPALVVAGRWDGTMPARHPGPLAVFTSRDTAGPGTLTVEGLVELGRRIGSDLGRLAKGQFE